jgi:hypothetical protein
VLAARLHPLKSRNGKQLYSVIFRGKLLVERSADPECEAARALLVQGFTGKLCLSDAGGFSITKKREPWGVRYLYTPRPPMLRTIIDIEKAAMLRSVETGNAPRFRRNETCAEGPQAAGTDDGEANLTALDLFLQDFARLPSYPPPGGCLGAVCGVLNATAEIRTLRHPPLNTDGGTP